MPSKIICTSGLGCEEAGACLASDPDNCGVNLADVDETVEAPSPVEVERARKDAELFGVGYTVDGRHVIPGRVTMFRNRNFPHVTTNELWTSLERVLLEKGASAEWTEYAMGELQVAATQYGADQWARGHASGAAGEPLPNSGEAPVPLYQVEDLGDGHWADVEPSHGLSEPEPAPVAWDQPAQLGVLEKRGEETQDPRDVMPGLPSQTAAEALPWNHPDSMEQSLGAALAEHGNGGD